MCLPMNQKKLDPKEEQKKKESGWYEEQQKKTYHTFAGFTYDFLDKSTWDDTPEEREKLYHELMVEKGGFAYWLATYNDMLFDQKANDEAYKFWQKTVAKRIPDPKKRAILAPETPPHPWGTKRPSLEQNFYEVMSMDHVDIIDINADPIVEVTEKGIKTRDGGVVEVDVLILATGFDSVTGNITDSNFQTPVPLQDIVVVATHLVACNVQIANRLKLFLGGQNQALNLFGDLKFSPMRTFSFWSCM